MRTNAIATALALLASALPSVARAAAPDPFPKLRGQIDGQDVSAQAFHYAWSTLERWIQLCRLTPACALTPEERELLASIEGGLDGEYQGKGLIFLSGKAEPGRFDLEDSAHRIAITGDEVGSAIEINTDFQPIGLPQALGLLVHELGHHHGVKDTPARPLDVLGAKFAALAEQSTERQTLAFAGQPSIEARLHHFGPSGSDLLLTDGQTTLLISEPLLRSGLCILPESAARSVRISNLRWEDPAGLVPDDFTQPVALRADTELECAVAGTVPQNPYGITTPRYVRRTEIRFIARVAPVDQNPEPGWWKHKAAILDPAQTSGVFLMPQDGAFFPAGGSPKVGDSTMSEAELLDVSSGPSKLSPSARTWRINGRIRVDGGFKAGRCVAWLSADDFKGLSGVGRYRMAAGACRLQAVPGGYAVSVEHAFPEDSPPRTYILQEILLEAAEGSGRLRVVPALRQETRFENPGYADGFKGRKFEFAPELGQKIPFPGLSSWLIQPLERIRLTIEIDSRFPVEKAVLLGHAVYFSNDPATSESINGELVIDLARRDYPWIQAVERTPNAQGVVRWVLEFQAPPRFDPAIPLQRLSFSYLYFRDSRLQEVIAPLRIEAIVASP
jgi:hypothetical protein